MGLIDWLHYFHINRIFSTLTSFAVIIAFLLLSEVSKHFPLDSINENRTAITCMRGPIQKDLTPLAIELNIVRETCNMILYFIHLSTKGIL